MVGITGLTGFSYFRKMMSYVFRGTMMSEFFELVDRN